MSSGSAASAPLFPTVGARVSITETITEAQVDAFARLSGDYNPLHMDAAYAQSTRFRRRVVHGMIAAGYVSRLIGMELPGTGSLWSNQQFRWLSPVFIGDTLTVTLTVTAASRAIQTVTIEVVASNQKGKRVMEGDGTVLLLSPETMESKVLLSQRSALITGGAKGIGRAIAEGLAVAGAAVTVFYHSEGSEAQDLCDALVAAGGQAFAVRGDVTDPASIRAAVEGARERFGKPVDVLVNNAGGAAEVQAFLETSWAVVQQQLDVHVRGSFLCCQEVLPSMVEAGSGVIVNIGSVNTWGAPPSGWTSSSMAKAALTNLTKSLAVEFGPKGIRVNMVSPGMTETDALASISDRLRKLQAAQTPLRRLGQPGDVAAAVLFLCSENASFITGADLPVCGGSRM